ncbi:unnamed protein product [Vitrella brassicaformis CCMP3155]|uniref:Tr-type G domain-containing protein n=1 Tax=Vitrella brassicaformis (strain CCMP3155) TaxID=1169540 RepID=A0A0G4F7A0_VITBC|nr:unnamed protein product [Vitrella brassicaformis CCMP3155]|mmetsp:Transcript_42059/g.105013  ORF Transcript_42059/g.105013 Transcript_42059/m.105013 type:complete len:995 (-) Transcript_42059:125-3109(-)|eukprot:CEM07887.1 unnamed protein product [Vitrella brassicaformis CCMP3155]
MASDLSELYDAFGNYIGPPVDENEDDDEEDIILSPQAHMEDEDGMDAEGGAGARDGDTLEMQMEDVEGDRSVVLFEDKKFYPDADEVYGGAETLVQEEDTQPLTEPIIAPVRTKNFDLLEKDLPSTTFSFDFLSGLMYKRELIRNICLLGHLHHGKTHFMDMLVQETHEKDWRLGKSYRYTDTRVDEQERGLSIKAVPMSLILQTSQEKSYLVNILDTPGHVCFADEAAAAMRISDGAVILIDALEGVMANTERLLKFAVQENLTILVVINCIDRLIMELRLPPNDAYHKLRHTIEEVNSILESTCSMLGHPAIRVSPIKGTVAFASGYYQFAFTVHSFAQMYAESCDETLDHDFFARCLWGDVYFDPESRTFRRSPPPSRPGQPRTFVQFILEPLYKIFAHTSSEEQPELEPLLRELGVFLRKDDFILDTRSLVKKVSRSFFGTSSAFVDMVVAHVPNPRENARRKVEHIYTGDQKGLIAAEMKDCATDGHLMIHTTKNYHRPDCGQFDVLGRVMSGTIYKGQRVKVLGEAFSLDDDEDKTEREVTALWIYEGRYRVEVSHVPAGNWVLIGGVDPSITKTSTITNIDNDQETEIFAPLKFNTSSVIKVACEPLNPSDLPKMLEGLRKIDKSYPLAKTKVEESGEHVIVGTGEIAMDCMLHDLRKLYGDLEIKVADPVVTFCETVTEHSTMKCFAETPNKKNKVYMAAEQLDPGVADDLEKGLISSKWEHSQLGDFFMHKYSWDVLSARSIWAFGPDAQGPNMLLDETLPTDVDKALLGTVRDLIVQGFQWATREGPLIEENIRNVKFKLNDALIASDPISRGGGQIIPTARRVAYSAFLLATPRLMEPVLYSEIQCPADCVSAVYTVLARRRGRVVRDLPKPGTPLYICQAVLPAIESFGFETDLRTHTSGQAFCMSMFDRWEVVPGDPLDKSIVLRPLEPAPHQHLAREFLLKTRRRKGLSEDVALQKYFDEPMLKELRGREEDFQDFQAYF